MKNTIVVFALFAFTAAACDRTPLRTRANTVVSDGASDTSVGTSSVSATKTDTATTTQTASANDTSTQTVTKSDTASVTSTATQTKTDTSLPTATASATATAVGAPFYIVSAYAEAVDAFGNAAPDVRSFGVQMSGMAQWVSVSIYEKQTQAPFYSDTVTGSPLTESLYMSPGKWTKGLSPNTTYNWVITSAPYAPDPNTHFPAAYTGEFTTGSFDPGMVSVSFTTAIHDAGFTDAVPGQKDIWMGTILVKNATPHTNGLNGLSMAFNAWTPAVQAKPYIDGSIGDYLTNCRLMGWPNIESFGAPFVPSSTTSLNLSKILKSQESQLFDVTCDLTDKQPKQTTKVAVEVTNQIPQMTGFGLVSVGPTNGDPPQVYVLLVGKDDVTSADPLPLYVLQADDQPQEGILTANTSANLVTRLKLYGANEAVRVVGSQLQALGDNVAADIVKLSAFDGADALFCSGSLDSAGRMTCRNDKGLFIVDGPTVMSLRVDLGQVHPIEDKMAASGDKFSAGIVIEPTVPIADRSFKAIGMKSGRSYSLGIDDPTPNRDLYSGLDGDRMTIRKTQPTVAAVALSSDETKITNASMLGIRQTVLRFAITADNNADVSIKHLAVRSSVNNVGALFYELHVGGMVSYAGVTGTYDGITFDLQKEVVVSAGTTKIFEVSASVYNASKGASIVTSLLGDDNENGQNFLWSDNSAGVHSLTSADWWNGYQVKNLPTASQKLSQ